MSRSHVSPGERIFCPICKARTPQERVMRHVRQCLRCGMVLLIKQGKLAEAKWTKEQNAPSL